MEPYLSVTRVGLHVVSLFFPSRLRTISDRYPTLGHLLSNQTVTVSLTFEDSWGLSVQLRDWGITLTQTSTSDIPSSVPIYSSSPPPTRNILLHSLEHVRQ